MNLRHQIINQVVRILRDIKSVTIWKINILTQIADGHRCEQWPFNLPFHRTGLTAQPEQRSNLTWEDEASTKIGFPRFDLGAPFRNNIWTFNRGQGRAHAWEDSGNPFDRDRLVNLSDWPAKRNTANWLWQNQPSDEKVGKPFVGSRFSQGCHLGFGYYWKYLSGLKSVQWPPRITPIPKAEHFSMSQDVLLCVERRSPSSMFIGPKLS